MSGLHEHGVLFAFTTQLVHSTWVERVHCARTWHACTTSMSSAGARDELHPVAAPSAPSAKNQRIRNQEPPSLMAPLISVTALRLAAIDPFCGSSVAETDDAITGMQPAAFAYVPAFTTSVPL